MATSKPVDLCTHLMPSGKLCRGIALRNERLCRAHIRNHRFQEREWAHNQAMDRLRDELDLMDIPELLQTLQEKLTRITSIVRAYPEARLTLSVTIDRLNMDHPNAGRPNQLNLAESIANLQRQQNQSPSLNRNDLNTMFAALMNSIV